MADQTPNTYVIRKAILNDLRAIVDLNMRSFNPNSNLVVCLGARYVEKYYKWFIESSITYTLVADENGQIIGHTAGCDRSYQGVALRHTFFDVIWGFITHPLTIFRGHFIGRFIEIVFRIGVIQDVQDIISSSHLAVLVVDKSARGKGVAVNLLNEARAESYRRGHSKMRSTIPRDNITSYKMHLRGGFEEIEHLSTKDNIVFEIDLL